MRTLPPLNALRAFEAVARLGNMQQAANELCVTHGAVSRQVKQLESWLGVNLFDRSQRSMSLNEVGRVYRQTASAALDMIHESTINTRQHAASNVLGVATTHSIASKWLMPLLTDFSALYPDIEVWMSLSQQLTSFSQPAVHVALRIGQGPWPGLVCIPLMRDKLITVVSPQLLEQGNSLETPGDLARFTLLHDQDPRPQWRAWLQRQGLGDIDASRGPRYSSAEILIQAAIGGLGIGLVSEILVAADIDNGLLIQPLEPALDDGTELWLVMPESNQNQPIVRAFCQWLQT
jgi:LysR family glycine cleavage system transcriptional activator